MPLCIVGYISGTTNDPAEWILKLPEIVDAVSLRIGTTNDPAEWILKPHDFRRTFIGELGTTNDPAEWILKLATLAGGRQRIVGTTNDPAEWILKLRESSDGCLAQDRNNKRSSRVDTETRVDILRLGGAPMEQQTIQQSGY